MKTGLLVMLVGFGLSSNSASAQAIGGVVDGGGVPNPASKNCLKLKGTLEIYSTEEGDGGYCQIGDGLIEEWTLYRATVEKENTDAARTFLAHPAVEISGHSGNPASHYCLAVGGDLVLATDVQGGQTGVCEFADGSIMEEWTLFGGPSAHKRLAKILRKAAGN